MHSGCTKDVLADEAGLMIEEDIRPNEPTGDSNRMSCEHTIWTVNDVPISLFSFCGDISHEKTPKILIQSFWGVFPGEMQPQKLERPCLFLEHHYRPQVKVLHSFYYLSKETPQFYWCATSTNGDYRLIHLLFTEFFCTMGYRNFCSKASEQKSVPHSTEKFLWKVDESTYSVFIFFIWPARAEILAKISLIFWKI